MLHHRIPHLTLCIDPLSRLGQSNLLRFGYPFAPPPAPIRIPILRCDAQRPYGLTRPHHVCAEPSYLCRLIRVRRVPIPAPWSAELAGAPSVASALQDVLPLNGSVLAHNRQVGNLACSNNAPNAGRPVPGSGCASAWRVARQSLAARCPS